MQSDFIEAFKGSFWEELFDETLLQSLTEAREKITTSKEDTNRHTPHSSRGNLTPWEFATKSRLENKAT